ncbi:MAG TPA: ASKHA domain-containing protein [Spirochaetota bacterium]|nr:ASKHA domain-containing protein [Spirochaetota bacterium]
MGEINITLLPDNVTVAVPRGENLLRAAHAAGVHINSSCGGQGTCGKCRVLVKKGSVTGGKTEKISDADFARGYRLACLSHIETSLEVEIPPESRLHRGVLDSSRVKRPTGRLAMPRETEALAGTHHPVIEKKCITIDAPDLEDNASDLSRILRALKKQHGIDDVSADYPAIRELSAAIRDGGWKATAAILHTRFGTRPGKSHPRIISIEAGDTSTRHYSIAIDVGTTTVCGELLDLARGETIAEASDYNGQIKYGEDVISRMVFAQKGDGLTVLQKTVAGTINGVIAELLRKGNVGRDDVPHITIAANTAMTHLLLGLDTRHIRSAPYTPVVNQLPPVKASDLGLDLPGHAYLYAMPMISSYVGGDIVAGVLASGLHRRDKNTLFIDIGTNGEIVVGNREWLVTASCSAGPAFEGGGIRHGMRATFGAIEEIRIDLATCEPVVFTIGEEKPKGVCGSGIINIVAEFLETGLLEPNGKFRTDGATGRLRRGADGMEYVLVTADRSGIDGDIVITEVDIDNFMRAKGAMYAGYQTLLESVGLSHSDLDEVIIAGAFGSYVDIEKSIITGLFPDLPVERFSFIGNSSLQGARLAAMSRELLAEAEEIAARMTNFELSENKSFMDHYVASLFFPHTEMRNFPTVMEKFKDIGGSCGSARGGPR